MLSREPAIIVALIVVNALLSMSELAVVSSRPARLTILADRGFDLDGWHFEVVDLDGRRIDKVLASRRDQSA